MRRKIERSMRRALCTAVAALGLLGWAAVGEEAADRPTFNLSADWASAYVWRGLLQNEDPVIQPSATVAWKGLSLNVWGSVDTTRYGAETSDGAYADREWKFEEVDYTLSYTYAFDAVSLTGGGIVYTFPGSPWENTSEVFVSAALTKVPLTPTLSVYYDVDEVEGFYANLGVSHKFELVKEKLGLTLGAGLGAGDQDMNRFYYGEERYAFSDVSTSAQLDWTVRSWLTLSAYARYSEIVDSGLRDVRDELPDSGSALSVFGVRASVTF